MSDLIDDNDELELDDEGEEIIEDEWGIRTEIVRALFSADAGVTEKSRSYTEIDAGMIKFGYRDVNSLTRTLKYTLAPSTYQSGSSTYYGIACSAQRIKIAPDLVITRSNLPLDTGFRCDWGSETPASMTATFVTQVNISRQYGVDWVVEDIPFKNGLCVVRR